MSYQLYQCSRISPDNCIFTAHRPLSNNRVLWFWIQGYPEDQFYLFWNRFYWDFRSTCRSRASFSTYHCSWAQLCSDVCWWNHSCRSNCSTLTCICRIFRRWVWLCWEYTEFYIEISRKKSILTLAKETLVWFWSDLGQQWQPSAFKSQKPPPTHRTDT